MRKLLLALNHIRKPLLCTTGKQHSYLRCMKLATVSCSFALRWKPSVKLFCRFVFVFLRGGQALRFFATHGAFPDVISAVIVPQRRAATGLHSSPS